MDALCAVFRHSCPIGSGVQTKGTARPRLSRAPLSPHPLQGQHISPLDSTASGGQNPGPGAGGRQTPACNLIGENQHCLLGGGRGEAPGATATLHPHPGQEQEGAGLLGSVWGQRPIVPPWPPLTWDSEG